MEREVTAADGSRVVSRVEVGYTQLGTLTTEEQKNFVRAHQAVGGQRQAGSPSFLFPVAAWPGCLRKKGWGDQRHSRDHEITP